MYTRPASCPACSRRRFLKTAALAPALFPSGLAALGLQSQETAKTANGGPAPYPIPWLDKNGSHNQPAGPNL
jgi:hypothetical protein